MIYKGLKYPFSKTERDIIASSEDNDVIRESILQIVQTSVNDRVMRPDFGCKLHNYIFDNADSLMLENIKSEIIRSVGLFEPRAKIVDVVVELSNDNLIDITLIYDTNFMSNNKLMFTISRG